jgi:hypothetical protein
MTQHLLSQPRGESKSTIDGLRSIAINVLGQAGYGQPQHWSPQEKVAANDGTMSYFDAVSRVIYLLVLAALIPSWILRLGFMPNTLRELGQAVQEYPTHTTNLLDKERVLAKESGEERSNLLAMLAKLSDGDVKDTVLTAEEIQGNLFLVSSSLHQ